MSTFKHNRKCQRRHISLYSAHDKETSQLCTQWHMRRKRTKKCVQNEMRGDDQKNRPQNECCLMSIFPNIWRVVFKTIKNSTINASTKYESFHFSVWHGYPLDFHCTRSNAKQYYIYTVPNPMSIQYACSIVHRIVRFGPVAPSVSN